MANLTHSSKRRGERYENETSRLWIHGSWSCFWHFSFCETMEDILLKKEISLYTISKDISLVETGPKIKHVSKCCTKVCFVGSFLNDVKEEEALIKEDTYRETVCYRTESQLVSLRAITCSYPRSNVGKCCTTYKHTSFLVQDNLR